MGVHVYFKNGKNAYAANAVRVEVEEIPYPEGYTPAGQPGIALYDAQNRLVGQFVSDDIAGYRVTEPAR